MEKFDENSPSRMKKIVYRIGDEEFHTPMYTHITWNGLRVYLDERLLLNNSDVLKVEYYTLGEILEMAREKFPLGTRFSPHKDENTYTSDGEWIIDEVHGNIISSETENEAYGYARSTWARVKEPKQIRNANESSSMKRWLRRVRY